MNNAWTERSFTCERINKAVRRLAAVLLFTTVTTAEATPIIQSVSLNQLPGNPFSLMSFSRFDSSLGSLDSVRLQLNGTLYGEILTSPNFQGQNPAPTPYSYQMFINHQLTGFPTFDFKFSAPAKFVVQGTASGTGGPNPVALAFSYSMTFDANTDLSGFTAASTTGLLPPGLVESSREAFVATPFTGPNLLLASQLTLAGISSPLTVQPVLGLNGASILTYNYTEFVDLPGDPVAVPEPGMLGLLIAGLLAMCGRRRLRAAAKR